ncbi:MAG TPA: serine hydrolase domain-containing protein [Cellulomonas sp.]
MPRPVLPVPLRTAPPERHGLPAAAVLRLLDDLGTQGLDPHTLLIARHADVLLRAAWAPYALDRPAQVYSASKSVVALAVGHLEAAGRITLTDPVDRYLDLPNPSGLTVHHLLTMTTGHSREQTLAMPLDPRALLTTPPAHPVGSRFAYSSPASLVLAHVVRAVSGEQPTAYLRPRLLDPLGIGPRWWRRTDGVEQGFSGLHLTVDDLARIGLALAADGTISDRQVVPPGFVRRMTRAWAVTRETGAPDDASGEPDPDASDWSLGYGYQVWRSRHGFRLDGAYGQFAVVDPDRDVVIAYQGATTDAQRTLDAIWRLLESFRDEPAPTDPARSARLAARVSGLDSWDARRALVPQDGADLDADGWALAPDPAGPDRWLLDLPRSADHPGGRLVVPAGRWSHDALRSTDPGSGSVPVAVRGEQRSDGTVHAHLVSTASPHRVLLTRAADGALDARWHTAPLRQPTLSALLVPPIVGGADGPVPPVAAGL